MTHHHNHPEPEHHTSKPGLHQDWRVWIGVLLMLAAMVVYVFSADEALAPGEPLGEQVPAAAE